MRSLPETQTPVDDSPASLRADPAGLNVRSWLRALALAALTLAATACVAPHPGGGMGEPCSGDRDCSSGLACFNGPSGATCQVRVDAMTCEPGAPSCDAQFLLRCGEDGRSLTFEKLCPNGCSDGECFDSSCTPGEVRCDDGIVSRCHDGGQWLSLEFCPSGCEDEAPACRTGVCRPGSRRCMGGSTLETCSDDGSTWLREDCAASGGGRCVGGIGIANAARCASPLCAPGAARCEGDTLYRCDEFGDGEVAEEHCASGCESGACLSPACTAGATRCDGDAIVVCRPDGRGHDFLQHCTTGCDSTTGKALCLPQVCSPLAARCGASGPERCLADGSGWQASASCDPGTVCVDGSCTLPPGACVEGTSRCTVGGALQECRRIDGQLGWQTSAHCLGGCADGTCAAGGSCRPFEIGVALLAENEALPADGRSTVLVISSPILGDGDEVVPDGTLITLALDPGTGAEEPAALLTADARNDLAGLQVPVRDGRIEALVRVPKAGAGEIVGTMRAQIHGRPICGSELRLRFRSSQTARFAAEDFSTTRARAPSSIATWDTAAGELRLDAFDGGDGRDGDLVVAEGEVVDLGLRQPVCDQPTGAGAAPSCRGWPDLASSGVLAIHEGTHLQLSESLAPFGEGTRLLLVNLRGEPGRSTSVGAWELATSLGEENGLLRLAAPVTRHFGEGGNAAEHLDGQVVRVFRIPQYRRVHIAGTLTAPAFDGHSGGVLAFFAQSSATGEAGNRVTSTGRITMAGKGYRGADAPPHAQTAWAGEGMAGGHNRDGITGNVGAGGGGYLCGDGFAAAVAPNLPPPGNVNRAFYGSGGSHATPGSSSCAGGASAGYGSSTGRWLHLGGGSGSQSESAYRACPEYAECCIENEPCLCVDRQECCHTPATCCTEWQECCTEWNVGCTKTEACVNTFRDACRKRLHAPIPLDPRGCTCERYQAARTEACGCELFGDHDDDPGTPDICITYRECEHESHGCTKYCGCAPLPGGGQDPSTALCPCLPGFDGPHPCNNLPGHQKPSCCFDDDPNACEPWASHYLDPMCPSNPQIWGACPPSSPNYPNCAPAERVCPTHDPLGVQVCDCLQTGPTEAAGCKTVAPSGSCVDGPAQCQPGKEVTDESVCGCASGGFGEDDSCECEEGAWESDPACACTATGRDVSCGCEPRLDKWAAAHPGAAGGGLVFIGAAALELAAPAHGDDLRIDVTGANPTVGAFGGAGGTVYVQAGRLRLGGAGAVRATGGAGGGNGRVFLSAENLDSGFNASWASPAAKVTTLLPAFAQSRDLLPNEPSVLTEATALLLPRGPLPSGDSPAAFHPAEALAASGLVLSLSADGGVSSAVPNSNGSVIFNSTLPPTRGRVLQWRVRPADGAIDAGARAIAIRAVPLN